MNAKPYFSKLKAARRFLPMALLVCGALLLVYVAVEYSAMYFEQRKLAHAWEEQQKRAATHAASEAAAESADDNLTRLSIPKINLDAVVIEGTAYKQLAVAPGHLKHTSAPGENGNAVITAHRDTFFRHIYELQKGDAIEVRRKGKLYQFEVTGKRVVASDDLSVVRDSKEPRLTLITCYPIYYIGPAPERLAVFSKLIEDQPQAASSTSSGRAQQSARANQ